MVMRHPSSDGAVLVALFPAREGREIAQRLAPGDHAFEGSRVALVQELSRGRVSALVLPATCRDGLPALPLVAQLRVELPALAVVVIATPESTGRDVSALRLTSARVAADADQAQAALQHLGVHHQIPGAAAHRLRQAVDQVPDDLLRDLLWQVASDPAAVRTGRDLAAAAGVKYRTLCRWAAEGRWPSPHGIVRLGRLLRYAVESGSPHRRALAGFPNSRALRAAAAQQLGEGTGEGVVTVPRLLHSVLPILRPRVARAGW